jgi:multidrug efflux pump subunit AcrA (membrane-fusion protein)
MGQPASIVLDAFPGEEFAGRVTKIAVKPDQETGGVITYLVTVETVGDAPRLRAGMTANAAIETNLLEDVLVIPDRAVQVEAETGRVYVERLTADGEISRVEVALGKRGQGVIEVRAGLSEGDRLLVPGEQQATQAQQSEQGGFRPGNPPTRPQ